MNYAKNGLGGALMGVQGVIVLGLVRLADYKRSYGNGIVTNQELH